MPGVSLAAAGFAAVMESRGTRADLLVDLIGRRLPVSRSLETH